MDRLAKRVVALFTATAVGISGCGLPKQQKMTLEERNDASVYDSTSLQLEEPGVDSGDPFGVAATAAPVTIKDGEPPEYIELRLEEVVQTALKNSRVLRDLGGQVLRAPSNSHTIHDPSIME